VGLIIVDFATFRKLLTLWSHPSDLNRRPFDYESNALPTELGWLEGVKRAAWAGCGSNFSIYVVGSRCVKRKSELFGADDRSDVATDQLMHLCS
jgi:hypothetical protein